MLPTAWLMRTRMYGLVPESRLFFFCLRESLTMFLWMTWSSPYEAGWPRIPKDPLSSTSLLLSLEIFMTAYSCASLSSCVDRTMFPARCGWESLIPSSSASLAFLAYCHTSLCCLLSLDHLVSVSSHCHLPIRTLVTSG